MLNWQHSEPPASKSGRQLGRGQEENVPREAPPRASRLLRGRAAAGRGVGCRGQRGAGARTPPWPADGEAAPATPSRPPARTKGRQHGRRETHPSKQYHSHRKGWLPDPVPERKMTQQAGTNTHRTTRMPSKGLPRKGRASVKRSHLYLLKGADMSIAPAPRLRGQRIGNSLG